MKQVSEPFGQRVVAAVQQQHEFSRQIAHLRRRGVSRHVLQVLIDGEARDVARALDRLTYTPPPRRGFSRRWWQLRARFGATDPHDVRRTEVASVIAKLNAGLPS
jgi:hypothetical protein